jgi:3-hydroxyacyl-[acyl-carrier-protein] dehydratase
MILSHQQIRAILPHRYPIILVDQVLTYEDGKSIHAIKNVSRNEPCFQGLVGKTVYYPRTLTLESFLQTGGILCYNAWSSRRHLSDSALLFGGLAGFTWYREVPAGVTIHHHAVIDSLFDVAAVYHGEIRCQDELVATVEQVTVAVRPLDEIAGVGHAP